jgi:cytochrome c oxidase cbb3-type subunit III
MKQSTIASASVPGPRRPRSALPGLRKWAVGAALVILAVAAATALGALHLRREHLQYRLLALEPNAAAVDPALVQLASQEAPPLFAAHCAGCHGADMRGRTASGAPDLTDGVWLYGDGSAYEIERTILYGVREGLGKSHNVTDMPAFGLTGKLSEAQIRALVQYVLLLSRQPHDPQQANEGRELWEANCADCHGFDAQGNNDYGAPDLTRNVWSSGGDAGALYHSIYFGQHHIMPGWYGVLTLEQIRALAVYIHTVSHPPPRVAVR